MTLICDPQGHPRSNLDGSKIKVILFDVKYGKNGKNYDVGPMGFPLDDLERLKVKVTNGPVTAIGMWGYKPVRITGVFVKFIVVICYFSIINVHVVPVATAHRLNIMSVQKCDRSILCGLLVSF